MSLPTHHEKGGVPRNITPNTARHHHFRRYKNTPAYPSAAAEKAQENAERRRRGALFHHTKKPRQADSKLVLKNHFVAMVGEFVGTSLFMIFALGGTNVANIPTTSVTGATTAGQDGSTAASVNTSSLLYIALSFGFSLAVNAWIFFRVSGGLFNPAVSLGMALVGALHWTRACLLVISQILGGIVGAAIIQAITPGTLNVRTTLGGGTSVAQGLFIEMFLTAMLMLAILLLAAEKTKATFLAPIGIGLALFIAELLGVYYTGGSLNPARSFGPDVVLHSFASYHWIYWLGPAMGATLAAGFYKFIKWLEFETVLGPEDGDAAPTKGGNVNPATQGPSMMGSQPGMLDASGPGMNNAHPDDSGIGNAEKAPAKSNILLSTQGAGLGDLLTVGDSEAVLELGNAPSAIDKRLDSIGEMLELLLAERHLNYQVGQRSPTTPTKPLPLTHHDRDSTATAVNDPFAHPATHGATASQPTSAATASNSSSEHHVYGNNGAHVVGDGRLPRASEEARGETTFAGHPSYGEPLGPTVDRSRQ